MKRIVSLTLMIMLLIAALPGCGKKTKEEPKIKLTPPPKIELPENYGLNDAKIYSSDAVIGIKDGYSYGFKDLAEVEADAKCFRLEEELYAPAKFLADLFGLEIDITDDNAVVFSFEETNISFSTTEQIIKINGKEYPGYSPEVANNTVYLNVGNLCRVIGTKYYEGKDGLMLMYKDEVDVNSKVSSFNDRFDLYESVVYNHNDVECDKIGAGVYKKVPKSDRLVGIAYTTWFRGDSQWGEGHTWDMPLIGKYRSNNRDVIRQHGIWLAEAGVDFVFIDWSNNVGYDPSTMRTKRADFRMIEESVIDLFEVWATIPNAPKICIFTGPGHTGAECLTDGRMAAKNDQIYDTFIANEEYNKMYFYYEGKPLLMCYGATPSFVQDNISPYKDDRFTIRWVTGFVGQQGNLFDQKTMVSHLHWSWEERGTQTFTVYNDMPEAMTIVAAWRQQGKEGDPGYIAPGKRDDGATFKKQWQRADVIGVKLVLIVSFNEWTTGEQPSIEVSKDIEPSETYGTFYIDLLREQIKKFKGKV